MPEIVKESDRLEFMDFCCRDNFGARVYARYLYDPKRSDVMIGRGDAGKLRCAFSVNGNSAVLCGIPGEQELQCLRFMGCDTVFLSEAAAVQSGLTEVRSGAVGMLTASVDLPGNVDVEMIHGETLRDIFPVLQYDLPAEDRSVFGNWYPELSHKLRHGQSKIAAVRQNGRVASVAVTQAVSPCAAVIGCVRTAEEYRDRGFASAVCNALGREWMRLGKQAYICSEHALFPFYEKIGYRLSDIWWYCKL